MKNLLLKENKYLELFNLFKDLGITESGIDRIYHYLLINRKIEDLKKVSERLDVNIKTAYKICSDLDELGLVHIYGRPMKIILKTPVIPIWETIKEKRIDALQKRFENNRKQLELSYENFLQKYGLNGEKNGYTAVEYLDFDLTNLSIAFQTLISDEFWKLAIGTPYETSIATIAKKLSYGKLKSAIDTYLPSEEINKIRTKLQEVKIYCLIKDEVLKQFIQSKEFTVLSQYYEAFNIEFHTLEVRVTQKYITNFTLTRSKLAQPFFTPNNKLLGLYLSEKDETYEEFTRIFDELFIEGIPISTYSDSCGEIRKNTFNDAEKFTLTTL